MKKQSKIEILSRLLSSPTISNEDWNSNMFGVKAEVGDLISLSAAPASKWYISWVVDIQASKNSFVQYLLESIEDESLCWWSNVGLNIYNRETVKNSPHWRWNDKQWEFKDRWFNTCYKKRDAYMVLPTFPIFQGDGVTIGTRKRFGMGSSFEKKFVNWKKVLVRDMLEFYDSTIF